MSEQGEPRTEWSLSNVVADRISVLRRRRNLNRDQVAERCTKLGYPALTAPALANIETGRRDKTGRRRRDVTVDELVVLAAALRVPPVLLLFPIGEARQVEVLPGRRNTGWDAAKWFNGEIPTDPDEVDEWRRSAAAVTRHRQNDQFQALWEMHKRFFEDAQDSLLDAGDEEAKRTYRKRLEDARTRRASAVVHWRDARFALRELGLTPPPLPEGAERVDDPPEVFKAL
jgi:transcriptional regulator with XRE-family HTH domain